MELPQTPIRPAAVDRFRDGIMIVFSDQRMILFPNSFLYEHRGDEGVQDFTELPAS
jgi:hypothetical protein